MPTKAQAVVTVEQFTQDLWEATRERIRAELAGSVTNADFEKQIPPWARLSKKARAEKIKLTREETLRLIDAAGYEVRKKP